jgi:2-haloacid dehalogenase
MKKPEFLTFDCYGTLIDFTLTKTTKEILGDTIPQEKWHDFLVVFRDVRFYECFAPYKRYSDLLRITFKKAMDICGYRYKNSYGDQLVAAVPTWGPFPDTKPILDKLGEHFKLVIFSNAEDEMIAQNVRNMDVEFYDVITAEAAEAYKPTPQFFYYAWRRLGCVRSDTIHIAQGFNYDMMPAHGLGLNKIWINRGGRLGNQEDYGPYAELPDLTGLPALLGI